MFVHRALELVPRDQLWLLQLRAATGDEEDKTKTSIKGHPQVTYCAVRCLVDWEVEEAEEDVEAGLQGRVLQGPVLNITRMLQYPHK